MPVTREQVLNDIKKHGLDYVKKSVANMNPVSAPVYDSHIKDYEEYRVSERREEREVESLSISRKALLISKIAMASAIIATIIAVIAIISK